MHQILLGQRRSLTFRNAHEFLIVRRCQRHAKSAPFWCHNAPQYTNLHQAVNLKKRGNNASMIRDCGRCFRSLPVLEFMLLDSAARATQLRRAKFGRRDQHAVCSFHGLPVGPLTLTTTPIPLRKPRARHDLNSAGPHERRASVSGRRAALRSGSVPLDAPLRPPLHCPARRPQTKASLSANLLY